VILNLIAILILTDHAQQHAVEVLQIVLIHVLSQRVTLDIIHANYHAVGNMM
jgi:hypothetical protein